MQIYTKKTNYVRLDKKNVRHEGTLTDNSQRTKADKKGLSLHHPYTILTPPIPLSKDGVRLMHC